MSSDRYNILIGKNTLARNFLLLTIFFLPVQTAFTLYVGFFTLKISQVFMFMSLGALLLVIRRMRFSQTEVFLLVYLMLLLSSVFISTMVSIDINRSLVLSFAIVLLTFAFTVPLVVLRDKQGFFYSLAAFVAGGSVLALYGIYQITRFYMGLGANVNYQPWDPIPRVPYLSVENVHANFALTPCLILLAAYFHYRGAARKLAVLLLLTVNLSALVLTNARGAILAYIISSLLMLTMMLMFGRNRSAGNWLGLAGLLAVLVLLVTMFSDFIFARFEGMSTGDGSLYDRIKIITEAYNSFRGNIFFGIGLGNFSYIIGYKKDIHNIVLMLLTETGVIATVLFVMLFVIIMFLQVRVMFSKRLDYDYMLLNIILFCSNTALMLQAMGEPALYNMNIFVSLGISCAIIKMAEAGDAS